MLASINWRRVWWERKRSVCGYTLLIWALGSSRPGGSRSRRHARHWWRSMERYVFLRIGRRPVSEVNTADMLEILTPIWHVKAATAREVRQRIRAVLEWAVAVDLRTDNPCDRIGPVLGPQGDIVRHMRALPHAEVAAAVETVRTSGSAAPAIRLAFEFLGVCAVERLLHETGRQPAT